MNKLATKDCHLIWSLLNKSPRKIFAIDLHLFARPVKKIGGGNNFLD